MPEGELVLPADTHVVLATYHTNRTERYWGKAKTGYPAAEFAPQRSDPENLAKFGRTAKDGLHFAFGYGPRVCIGKGFAEAEAYIYLNKFLERFRITAVHPVVGARAGFSSSPEDQVEALIEIREPTRE